MLYLVFMGYVLLVCGIGLVDVKVKVVVDVCELMNVVEVRSFFGLVNFIVCFIFDLVIVFVFFC